MSPTVQRVQNLLGKYGRLICLHHISTVAMAGYIARIRFPDAAEDIGVLTTFSQNKSTLEFWRFDHLLLICNLKQCLKNVQVDIDDCLFCVGDLAG